MLRAVGAELARAGALVSFNGKSFDAPVLETRYLFHRLRLGGRRLPHVDLLHPARRFWGDAGRGCSLVALEPHLLGARRTGDVPGFEIPARYFQFRALRRCAAAGGGARAQPAGSAVARRLDGASAAPGWPAAGTATRKEALALGRVYATGGLERARARVVSLAAAHGGRYARARIGALPALALGACAGWHAAVRRRRGLLAGGCSRRRDARARRA